MLVVTRKKGQSVQIGNDICLSIVEVKGERVRVGISAPRELPILRQELSRRTREHNLRAADLPKQALEGWLASVAFDRLMERGASPGRESYPSGSLLHPKDAYLRADGFWSRLKALCFGPLSSVSCRRIACEGWQHQQIPTCLLATLEALLRNATTAVPGSKPLLTMTLSAHVLWLELKDPQTGLDCAITLSLSGDLTDLGAA